MPNTWSDPYAQTGAGGTQYKPKQAANASEQVLGLYQSNFGRSASSPEVDTWIKNATQGQGSAYLNPDQLSYIQTEFQKAPEYAQYTGQRPTIQAGQYIPGVTLGTTLQDDPYFKQPTTGGGLVEPNATAEQETTNAGIQGMVRERLMGLMNTPTPSLQDPALANAASAFSAGQNKATARTVNQNAEAFGAAGLESSGARLGADRAAIQEQGLNEGTFNANLILNQLDAQRAQVQQGLQFALASGDQDMSRRLQAQLAQLNAQVQRESLAQSGKLGQADLDLRQKGLYGNLNLGMLDLAQRGRIANDNMGFNIAQLESQMNNAAILKLLTGA
jgi:hypothetical protein